MDIIKTIDIYLIGEEYMLTEISGEIAYDKFYNYMPINTFMAIVSADPTSKIKGKVIKKLGKFSNTILNWYKKGKLEIKNLDSLRKKLINFKGDISRLKSFDELAELSSNESNEVIYSDSQWIVEIPKDFESSCGAYGKITSWCTASKSRGPTHWKSYNKKGKLYVIRNKNKPNKELYQLFINKNNIDTEIQDRRNDDTMDLEDFFKENEKLGKFFVDKIGLKILDTFRVLGRRFHYEIKNGVYVFAEMNIDDANLKEIPQELKDLGEYHVRGYFDCSINKLTSLEGIPTSIGGLFRCGQNKLTSLKYAPKIMNSDFYCNSNNLTSLEGAPKSVGGDFHCDNNKLTTLKGAPENVGKNFHCNDNKLTTLKGAPKIVGGNFDCSNNTKQFTRKEVRKISKVKRKVTIKW